MKKHPPSPPGVSDAPKPERWRLQRWMAQCGTASRRECEELIRQGRVAVNGVVTTKLGTTVDPDKDEVRVDGERLSHRTGVAPAEVWALNKPQGVTSTLRDPHAARTLTDLLPRFLRNTPRRLYPVGRLDRDSEGLLLLTNDGSLAHRLAHPRYHIEKEYDVVVLGSIPPDVLRQWEEGIEVPALAEERGGEGLVRMSAQARFAGHLRRGGERCQRLRVILQEGRKRQLRRMAAAAGTRVLRLRRVRIGPILLGNLASGDWRKIEGEELAVLRQCVSGGAG